MNRISKINSKKMGFMMLACSLAFIALLTFFTIQELEPITTERITDCQTRIEKLEKDSEGASQEVIDTNQKNINVYTERISMLQNRAKYYSVAMILVALFLFVGFVYQKVTNTYFMAQLVALCILLAIGLSFRVIISLGMFDILILAVSIIAAVVTYLVSRRISKMNDVMFYALVAAVAGLLLANLIFGKVVNGARNWIFIGGSNGLSVQPGELIKFLLVMMGAYSYQSQKRVIVYYFISLISCIAFLCFKDLGTAIIMFALMLMMTLLLLDNPKLFTIMVVFAVTALICAFFMLGYVRERFANWGNAMSDPTGHQAQIIKSIILGGFGGLGIENSTHIINIFSIDSDVVIAGIMSVFGIGMLLAVMICYSVFTITPKRNVSIYPWSYYVPTQFSVVITIQVLLNFLGPVDVLPFTGIVAPFLSNGGSASVTFFMLFGLVIASLNPKIKTLKTELNAA